MERRKDVEETTEDERLLMLHQVKRSLHQVATFLLPYLPLANAHNSDFIVCRHWHSHILPSIATDLLKLSDDDLCLLPSGALFADESVGTKEEISQVTDGPSGQFQQADPSDETKSLMVCQNAPSDGTPQWDRSIHARWSHASLQAFVHEAGRNTLPQLGVLTDIGQLKCQLQQDSCDKVHISNFMSPKKSHEVDAMAEMCALLASNRGLSKVVDIGSGRGYLGCQMALMYGLKVFGIDSSDTNTESAETRAGKLRKQWQGLVRNAQEGNVDKSPQRKAVKGSKERTISHLALVQSKDEDIPDLSLVFNDENSLGVDLETSQDKSLVKHEKNAEITVSENFNQKCSVLKKTTDSSCTGCCQVTEINKQPDVATDEKTKHVVKIQTKESAVQLETSQDEICHETSENKGQNVQSTTFEEDVCRETLAHKRRNVQTTTSQDDPRHGTSKNKRPGDNTAYVAITRYVTPDLNLQMLFDTHSAWSACESKETGASGDRDGAVLMSGLHTCGNLASSMLQLFCSSDVATVACNIGCCYHLLEEQFLASPFSKQEGGSTVQFGFPMSMYLRQRGCQLGRNARMLASQAPERLANHKKLPDRSIYWRALLQEILCDVIGVQRDDWQARNDWQVGKIASKCHTFTEYVHKALQKLRLTHVELSDEAIEEYESTHREQEHKMRAFFQLKAVLAPCIEALILLDRLLYLFEQDNMTTIHLVQLFDPITSPRCYALIALK